MYMLVDMEKKEWPAMEPCNHNNKEKDQSRDRLSLLPDDIILPILSSTLSMMEAASASLLSRRLKNLWRCFPILAFQDLRGMDNIYNDEECASKERNRFVRWVDHVVANHEGLFIDELRVTFYLDGSCQSSFDKWVACAFEKHVRKLELDFRPVAIRVDLKNDRCTFNLPRSVPDTKILITSLYLDHVNITTEVMECLLHSSSFIEKLCLVSSDQLTSLRVCASSLQQLKYLEVLHCGSMQVIDISAPKLLSFRYHGRAIKLHIGSSYLLSEVWIGFMGRSPIDYVFSSLSQYFYQLEHLGLVMGLFAELNSGIRLIPALPNLKHLELCVDAFTYDTLLGWTPLIEASPVLKKLTLKLSRFSSRSARETVKHVGHPLKSLETFEIGGFLGHPIDLEFAAYVLENAIMLKEVVVDFIPLFFTSPHVDETILQRLRYLERMVPEGVLFIIK